MAILWQQTIEDNHYEVRTAGASVRLYRNGVNHSQWNPNRPLTGSIWDLITLPTLHRPPESLQDVLVLGFGAGAVGRQIAELVKPKRIVGIELDPIHLSIADGFFDCSDGFELFAADAVEWVHKGRDQGTFDVIIEDLYGEEEGVPVRCVPMDSKWCEALCRMLKPGGMLIFNLIEPEKVPHLPMFQSARLSQKYPEVLQYQIVGYENRIVAFSEQIFEESCFREQFKKIGKNYPACRGAAKRYLRG